MHQRTVNERLKSLEKQNARLRLGVGGVLVLFIALVAMGQGSPAPVPDVVKAKSFLVVDDRNNTLAYLGPMQGDSAGIVFFDKSRVVKGVFPPDARPPTRSEARMRVTCMNNLRQIGALLVARQAGEGLKKDNGSAFLLQVASDIRDEDLDVFLCPGDPRTAKLQADPASMTEAFRNDYRNAPCSYRGPDAWLYNEVFVKRTGRTRIIACDLNGLDGKQPHHENGVCVLYSSSKVGFIKWEDMQGYEGGPVPVGPDSPDSRFRHLVP